MDKQVIGSTPQFDSMWVNNKWSGSVYVPESVYRHVIVITLIKRIVYWNSHRKWEIKFSDCSITSNQLLHLGNQVVLCDFRFDLSAMAKTQCITVLWKPCITKITTVFRFVMMHFADNLMCFLYWLFSLRGGNCQLIENTCALIVSKIFKTNELFSKSRLTPLSKCVISTLRKVTTHILCGVTDPIKRVNSKNACFNCTAVYGEVFLFWPSNSPKSKDSQLRQKKPSNSQFRTANDIFCSKKCSISKTVTD